MSLINLPVLGSTPGGRRVCGAECGCGSKEHPPHNLPPADRLYLPAHVFMEVTNRCNLDCFMCERKLNRPDDLMHPDVFDLAIEKLAPSAIAVELSGLGEPTLAPGFGGMCEKVIHRGNILYFPTNGTNLDDGGVIESLPNDRRTRVSISLDAASDRTYSRVRTRVGGGAYNLEDVLEKVRRFRQARPKAFMSSAFTAGGYNVDEFPDFVQRAADLGLQMVSFKPVRCWGIKPEEHSLRFRKEQTERALITAAAVAERMGITLVVERPPYSEMYANSGGTPGFVSYLDILPLTFHECGGSGGLTTTEVTGCYRGDVLLNRWGGEKVAVRDIRPGDTLIGIEPSGARKPVRIAKVYEYDLPTYTVTLNPSRGDRMQVVVSRDHRFLRPNRKEVITSAYLRAGDHVLDEFLAVGNIAHVEPTGLVERVYYWTVEGDEMVFGAGAFADLIEPRSTSDTGPKSETDTITENLIVTDPEVVEAEFRPRSIPYGQKVEYTDDVMGVLTDGRIVTCGAKHPIGDIRSDDFYSVATRADYQHHLRVRRFDPNLSKWCRDCEKMV